jgi:hypothetical protein
VYNDRNFFLYYLHKIKKAVNLFTTKYPCDKNTKFIHVIEFDTFNKPLHYTRIDHRTISKKSRTNHKNVRLDALTYDIISRHYKKIHNYITKTLLNHIDKYDTDYIGRLSYIKTSLKYNSIKSVSIYKKKEKKQEIQL